MKAIIRRELSAYFNSPIGYVYLGVVYLLSGYFLLFGVLLANSSVLTPVFQVLMTIIMFLTPILTMRLMTEDKRHKTDQILLTAPISLGGIVAGKFFAAALVYIAGISVTLVYAIALSFLARMNWTVIWGNYIGLLLLGFAFISIGQFISSLTENQAIAAIGGFVVMLAIFLLDSLPQIIPNQKIAAFMSSLSLLKRYTPITNGLLGPANLFYFASVCVAFLFLTTRVLEKRRWS
ncbi:MAG: ABC-2 transporter permease [Treponema sp.]|jgi:ABC-2 type transport system permease protein|nr:ABC-2 transporter permease [Treponema sp.]